MNGVKNTTRVYKVRKTMTNNSSLKFSVGYPCSSTVSFYDSIFPYLDKISEVYFGWQNFTSGRATFEDDPRNNKALLESDLVKFSNKGIRLNLLLNGNCHGEKAVSDSLADEICEMIKNAEELFKINSVTTASPFIAYVVKNAFPDIDVRASVNMWVDGISGMMQCSDLFDSFYVKRDYNYCVDEIKQEYEWCKANGKKLYLLANSGCIPNCTYHTFHDNMIAHSKKLEPNTKNSSFEQYLCRKLIANPENRHLILSGNLVRPEDIQNYEGMVDGIKLATRIHPFPAILIRAYTKGYWDGDITQLTEPGFSDVIEPDILKNSDVPNEYWQRKTVCLRAKNHGLTMYCKDCGYCESLYQNIKSN